MRLSRLFDDGSADVRGKIFGLYVLLVVANVAAWGWARLAFRDYPVRLGTALLAYTFGLRHAVDADHIAAIDNVTRKLMQDGKRPVGVGFFFSLGRSSVVVLASVAIAATATALEGRLAACTISAASSARWCRRDKRQLRRRRLGDRRCLSRGLGDLGAVYREGLRRHRARGVGDALAGRDQNLEVGRFSLCKCRRFCKYRAPIHFGVNYRL